MIRIIPATPYSDCNPQDFAHYFYNSFMVLRLTDMKDRIFTPLNMDGAIIGQYLTRAREWKPFQLKWDEWWKRVSLIAPFPVIFNLPTMAAHWQPNIAKAGTHAATGYRKSFPNVTSPTILRLFGKKIAEEMTNQSLVFNAFSRVYRQKEQGLPTLADARRLNKTAIACSGDFVIDKDKKCIWYKGEPVGKYVNDIIELPEEQIHLKDLMLLRGAAWDQVKVI